MTNTTSKQELIDIVLKELEKLNQHEQPTHFIITYAYTGHEEIVSDEISTVEEVVDEFINIINNHEVTEDCQYLEIQPHWEELKFSDALYLYELQESSKWKLL